MPTNYTHEVFYSEVRGTSVYTRVKINIDGESDPLVIGFDIPGSGGSQEAIDVAVQNRVAELVLERTGARSMTTEIIDQAGTQDMGVIASALQDQFNQVAEPVGLTVVVIPMSQATPEAMDAISQVFVDSGMDAKVSEYTKLQVTEMTSARLELETVSLGEVSVRK